MDFSKWDAQINNDDMSKKINEAKENGAGQNLETPAGSYMARVEKLEVGATKDGRPMLKAQFRVVDAGENASSEVTEYLSHFKKKKPCLFMNRVLAGTKDDANMIASAIGWLDSLDSGIEVEFKNYTQFADLVLDVYEEIVDSLEYKVKYDDDNFNSISISDIYDL